MWRESKKTLVLVFVLFSTLALWSCSASPQPSPTPEIVTVVSTVPVEVTRIVEIPKTVEVTRKVMVTQVVEVPVTLTPAPMPTDTPTPESLGYSPIYPTPTFPEGKVGGFSHLKLTNETEYSLVVNIYGPIVESYTLHKNMVTIKVVKEGQYTYTVIRDEKIIYRGTMNITNPDKHELKLREDKAVFLVP